MQRVRSTARLAQDAAGQQSESPSANVGSSPTSTRRKSSIASSLSSAVTMASTSEDRFWPSDRAAIVMDSPVSSHSEAYTATGAGDKVKHAATNNISGFLGGMLNRERKRSTKLSGAPAPVSTTIDGRMPLEQHAPLSATAASPSASPLRSTPSGKTRKLKRGGRPSTANDVDRSRSRTGGLFSMLAASRSEHDLSDPGQRASRPSTASGLPSADGRSFDDDNKQEVLAPNAAALLIPRRSVHNDPRSERSKRAQLVDGLQQMSINLGDLSSPSESETSSLDENVDLSEYPLPVRLGLVHPSDLSRSRSSRRVSATHATMQWHPSRRPLPKLASFLRHRPQYVDGYYLCTPPPPHPSTLSRSSSSQSRSSFGAGQSSPSPSPNGRLRGNSDARRPNFLSGGSAGKVFSSDPATLLFASPSSLRETQQQQWTLNDYFRVERFRRPGHFGVSERKTHAYSFDEAPYPFSYGQDSISSDMLMHITVEKAIGLSTLQWDNGPPRRVLDIGCGIGAWVMDMARVWPEAEFVGLDLVPIQKPLEPVGADDDKDAKPAVGSPADLHRRISWVVANVLQGLPFPDASFDCVNAMQLNAGVPQHLWPALLSEISRVLTPSGQVQLFDTDFSFLGSLQEIGTADLMNLILGNPSGEVRSPAALCRAPAVRQGDANDRRRERRNNALQAIFTHALRQRGICLTPSTMLEPQLRAMNDVAKVFSSEPRNVPILSRTHRKTFARTRLSDTADLVKTAGAMSSASVSSSSSIDMGHASVPLTPTGLVGGETTGLDELIGLNYAEGQNLFASSHQVNEHSIPELNVRIHDLDAVRMAILTSDALRYSDCRYFFWQELEALRRQDAHSALAAIRQRVAAASGSDGFVGESVTASTSSGSGDGAVSAAPLSPALRECLKRWPTFSAFECDMDAWKKEMQLRADSEELLRHKMRWGEAATRMDGWQQSEKMRKRREQQYWSSVNDKVSPIADHDGDAYNDEDVRAPSADSQRLKAGIAVMNALKLHAAHAAVTATAIQHATPLPDFVRPDIVAQVSFAADAEAEHARIGSAATVDEDEEEDDDDEEGDITVRQQAEGKSKSSAAQQVAQVAAAPEPAHEMTSILGFRTACMFHARKQSKLDQHGETQSTASAAA